MEEIKVGEYVRTRAGNIYKITKIIPYYENENLVYDRQIVELEGKHSGYNIYQLMTIIVKHSPNIIDLVQEGDYVNGHKVIKSKQSITYSSVEVENSIAKIEIIPEKEIKSIVTKEQFNQVKYEV